MRIAVVELARAVVLSEEGSQFGFNLKAPPPPAFIGSETLGAFECRQTTSRNTTIAPAKSQRPGGERVASVLVSHADQHSPPGPQCDHNSKHVGSGIPACKNSTQAVNSPLSSPCSMEDGPLPSHDFPEVYNHGEELQSRKSDSDSEEEFHHRCHIVKTIV